MSTVVPPSNTTTDGSPEEKVVLEGTVIGVLVLLLIISVIFVVILFTVVLENRRIRRKIKSEREKRRLNVVTSIAYSADGSTDYELGDNDSLLENEAYRSTTHFQVVNDHNILQELNAEPASPRFQNDTNVKITKPPYSMVENQAYGSVERDNVFTSSETVYEYI